MYLDWEAFNHSCNLVHPDCGVVRRTWGLCVDVPRYHVVVNRRKIVPSPIAVK